MAYHRFLAEGKLQKHEAIILRTLEQCPYELTAFGISKRCELTYHQVDRRMKRLRDDLRLVEIRCRRRDVDGSVRNAYRLVDEQT